MRSRLVIGNWKMNGDQAAVNSLVEGLLIADAGSLPELGVCPPFPYLQSVGAALAASSIELGAQNVCQFSNGAYTGEVSAAMLQDLGCRYVLVGHSERRQLFGESSQQVFEKAQRLFDMGLTPVICVGEDQGERGKGVTHRVVAAQIAPFLTEQGLPILEKSVLAYEPVWAIGTGLSATPRQAQDVHGFIRRLIEASAPVVAEKIQILYGGSVKPANAEELFSMPDIDGGLIGGASLVARDFLAIAEAARPS